MYMYCETISTNTILLLFSFYPKLSCSGIFVSSTLPISLLSVSIDLNFETFSSCEQLHETCVQLCLALAFYLTPPILFTYLKPVDSLLDTI